MENQHRKIKGYRELSQEEIDLMNEIKGLGPQIESVVRKLSVPQEHQKIESYPDQRWVALGRTHLQEGLMALTRSVAKPDFF